MLGFSFWKRRSLWVVHIAPSSLVRFKDKLRDFTERSWSVKMDYRIYRINLLLKGWINYFGIAKSNSAIHEVEEFLRTRLRVVRWKKWKKIKTKIKELVLLGIPKSKAYQYANSRKSFTRTAHSPILLKSFTNNYFRNLGLFQLLEVYLSKHSTY